MLHLNFSQLNKYRLTSNNVKNVMLYDRMMKLINKVSVKKEIFMSVLNPYDIYDYPKLGNNIGAKNYIKDYYYNNPYFNIIIQ